MCADTPETTAPDYKSTLNLPQTEFPMRAGLPKREPEWLERWEKIGVYDRLRDKAEATPRPPFTLHDGPPYANGHLHIGHALNKILKDMVVRSQQMMGRDARYIPGWDCHGLPIEWKIEEQYRQKGKNKDEVPVVELRQECRAFAEKWVDIQREEFKRLGVTGNWDDPYLTMNFHAEAVIAEEFMKFLMNGTLYQGSKPVMWSVVEKTALAEAEVEYHEHQSHTIWVKFPVIRSVDATGARQSLRGVNVVIWTTTPWTIPSNRAVAFNPELSYGLYEVTAAPEENWAKVGDKYLLADNLAGEVMKAARVDGFERLQDVTAEQLDLMVCAHPFREIEGGEGEWDYDVPLLPGAHVTDEAGTGFVHTAPSHGADDYILGVRHGLKMTYNVLEDGSFRPDLPLFGGAVIFDHKGKEKDANKRVIEAMSGVGALIARGRVKHSYPHSWRSKAPLIFRNTPQWFAAIDREVGDGQDEYGKTIRARALKCIDEMVQWTPPSGRNRIHSMIEARPDWVLSRQRAWGVPLTCFVKKGALPDDPEFLLRDPAVNARIVAAFDAEGADAWYAEGAKARFLGNEYDPDAYEQVFDVLDVWFDSGSTHAFVLRDRADGTEDGIADLYLEGTDQHRGWFHSSMLQSCGTNGRAPYRGVLTHGFTLDEKGNKMSKSLGNTILPEQVVKQYGADILRLWVAQTDYTADQRIGPEILKGVADSYRRLRNTMRFLLGSLGDLDTVTPVAPEDMPPLERWVLHRLSELDEAVRAGYAAYDFQGVFQKVFNFATVDLSAFYFDIRKDSLYCDADDSLFRRSALTVLDTLFQRLTTWLAPILPFTMEEVWLERYPGEDSSVHLQDMPATPTDWQVPDLAALVERVRAVRRVVTAALEVQRRDKVIGSSLEAAPVVHVEDASLVALLRTVNFADICIASQLTLVEGTAPDGAFTLDEVKGVGVVFALAEGEKCQRCWKILPDVGTHAHPGTCQRCNDALG
ncbi:isoleucine--tRNA ligase [Tropicimonas sediminicola]|uniref:Isoleucine--tRNA ligase n=1 Tax=Tropicimonas sediminicola TaxID=1031541 RepID=A0A239C9U7_9RHOB|nr:isoleucine--tRNA ligase [Tropicimonas sediminicola]SNS16123.1 Isoleucyl-tRNA synthetase [Tropicimonas sediminicola]